MIWRGALTAAVVVALVAVVPAAALGADVGVDIQFQAYAPTPVDVLPGETVVWTNVSQRNHTVYADDGTYASSQLPGGAKFSHTFGQVGAYAYHCTVHPGMVGEVDVREVTLGPLPTAAIPVGTAVQFAGRTTGPGATVQIQRADGSAFTTVGTATSEPDGTWSTELSITRAGDYRAAVPAGVSQTRRLLVMDRTVSVRPTRRGVAVAVNPPLPYGRVILQQYLRDRFGWWPQAIGRLDYVSSTTFRVRRPARVRVALVAADGWTPIATSHVLVLRR